MEQQKTISFRALQRCRTTMEDFCRSYLPLHGLDPAQGLFDHLDVLLFVEATIYQMDEENEDACGQLAAEQQQQQQQQQQQEGRDAAADAVSAPPDEQAAPLQGHAVLLEVLEQQQLLSERVHQELELGQHYWRLERRLCAELARLAPGHDVRLSLADVLATHEAKSFDYRVLHLLVHELLRAPYNEALLDFMRVDEMLIDIGDDLTDYEDDVVANSFNIYRAYLYLFGREAPGKLIERISQLEAQRDRLLAQLPADARAHVLKRQADAAIEDGADKWTLPDPIWDEAAFRAEVAAAEGGA